MSLLPAISQIFETFVYIQLFQYFTRNNLFHANQYGFRAEYSTELALSELVDRIDLDEKQLPIAIFIDLSTYLTPLTIQFKSANWSIMELRTTNYNGV